MRRGKRQGRWVFAPSLPGTVEEGPRLRRGSGTVIGSSATRGGGVQEGPYEAGENVHGRWIERDGGRECLGRPV